MRDLFAAPINGHTYLKPAEDSFRYIGGVFSGDGAVQIIQRASEIPWSLIFPYGLMGMENQCLYGATIC